MLEETHLHNHSIVDDTTGIFVTSLRVYFRTKDDTLPLYCQERNASWYANN